MEAEKAKLLLFGSLEQSPKGNMVAGSLTEARFGIHEDFFKGLFPYMDWPKPEVIPISGSSVSEDEERRAFLSDYSNWVAGQVPEAKFIHSSEAKKT